MIIDINKKNIVKNGNKVADGRIARRIDAIRSNFKEQKPNGVLFMVMLLESK